MATDSERRRRRQRFGSHVLLAAFTASTRLLAQQAEPAPTAEPARPRRLHAGPRSGASGTGERRCARAAPAPSPPPPPAPPTEVVVQGDRADSLKRASGSGTIITKKDIERAQPESSGELLRSVPGVQIRQEDPSGLRLNIGVRGLSPIRSRLVLMEEDGVPVVVSPYGEPELYYTTAVERVQSLDVIKGSDVLRYGPQTVGAVVRLHTWEPTEKPAWLVSGSLGRPRLRRRLGALFGHVQRQRLRRSSLSQGWRRLPQHGFRGYRRLCESAHPDQPQRRAARESRVSRRICQDHLHGADRSSVSPVAPDKTRSRRTIISRSVVMRPRSATNNT